MRTLFGFSKSMAPIHTMTVRTCTYTARMNTTALQASDCRPGQNGIAWKADRIAPSRLRRWWRAYATATIRRSRLVYGAGVGGAWRSDVSALPVRRGPSGIPGFLSYSWRARLHVLLSRFWDVHTSPRPRSQWPRSFARHEVSKAVMDSPEGWGRSTCARPRFGFVLHYGDRVGQSRTKVIARLARP